MPGRCDAAQRLQRYLGRHAPQRADDRRRRTRHASRLWLALAPAQTRPDTPSLRVMLACSCGVITRAPEPVSGATEAAGPVKWRQERIAGGRVWASQFCDNYGDLGWWGWCVYGKLSAVKY